MTVGAAIYNKELQNFISGSLYVLPGVQNIQQNVSNNI